MAKHTSSARLTELPGRQLRTFLDFPFVDDLDQLAADIAILGVPYGMPYHATGMANEQSKAPDAIRQFTNSEDIHYTRHHYDWDLRGPLFDGRDIRVADCGNVSADRSDHSRHYGNAEQAARKIFSHGATLIALGGDHGIPIPIMRALEVFNREITLIQIDAHMDWRDEINGEHNGYSSPIRRASELPWIGEIIQIGLRGIGSARCAEVDDAIAYGATLIDAYEMHETGMAAVLDKIPQGKPYYVTIDADGIDPTIMPAVMAQTPGGLNWLQLRQFIHGLVGKGRVVGLDLVEIAPCHDVGNISMIHAERLICNFIGACVRAGYYDSNAPT